MGHFIGKINFANFVDMRVADVEYDNGEVKKCVVLPIADNGIQPWKGEWQYWFRAYGYREPKGRFTHFLMKFVPIQHIKRMSQAQIEAFANHHIGGMFRTSYAEEVANEQPQEKTTEDFIAENL